MTVSRAICLCNVLHADMRITPLPLIGVLSVACEGYDGDVGLRTI